jgi:hypothetical protein
VAADSATDNWVDSDLISGPEAGALPTIRDFARELVTQYQRRHPLPAAPEEAVEVRSTDPGGPNSYEDLAGFGRRVGKIEHLKLARSRVYEGFHPINVNIRLFDSPGRLLGYSQADFYAAS